MDEHEPGRFGASLAKMPLTKAVGQDLRMLQKALERVEAPNAWPVLPSRLIRVLDDTKAAHSKRVCNEGTRGLQEGVANVELLVLPPGEKRDTPKLGV